MKKALITGIYGQDGSYLAELLLGKGYQIVGAVRDPGVAERLLPKSLRGNVELIAWPVLDQNEIARIFSQHRPNEVYNLTAYSSGERMNDDPVSMGEVNGLSVVRILEAIVATDRSIRLCQASSSEMFGIPTESPQTENTSLRPRSFYGAAKVYAHSMIGMYRERHRLFACSAIVFNHESPRRRLEFVTRKITHAAASIKLGLTGHVDLGNLDAQRDWSFAGDIVRGMALMLQAKDADDYVFASGVARSVREFCEVAFSYLGLDYRDFVRHDPAAFRPAETVPLVGDWSRARAQLGWKPEVDFGTLVRSMVDADLERLKIEKGAPKAQ